MFDRPQWLGPKVVDLQFYESRVRNNRIRQKGLTYGGKMEHFIRLGSSTFQLSLLDREIGAQNQDHPGCLLTEKHSPRAMTEDSQWAPTLGWKKLHLFKMIWEFAVSIYPTRWNTKSVGRSRSDVHLHFPFLFVQKWCWWLAPYPRGSVFIS